MTPSASWSITIQCGYCCMVAGVNMRVDIRNPDSRVRYLHSMISPMTSSMRGRCACPHEAAIFLYIYKWLQRQLSERLGRLMMIVSVDDRYSDVCFVFLDWPLPCCNSRKSFVIFCRSSVLIGRVMGIAMLSEKTMLYMA